MNQQRGPYLMLAVLLAAVLFSSVALRIADREIDRLRARVQELEAQAREGKP